MSDPLQKLYLDIFRDWVKRTKKHYGKTVERKLDDVHGRDDEDLRERSPDGVAGHADRGGPEVPAEDGGGQAR